MKFVIPWLIGLLLSVSRVRWQPFPDEGENPFLDLIAAHDPILYHVIEGWYYLAPWAAAGIGGAFLVSAWQIWFAGGRGAAGGRGSLPRWPASGKDDSLSLVVGETHHPTEAVESENPGWLTLSEKGLFTGVAVVGAVGTGKTSACMHPFAEQLFSWQAQDVHRKAAGLVLEVKGDFCYQIKDLLEQHGRRDDYLEIGLGARWQWNPLDVPWMDSYSLAYTIAGLMNQLFGRGKEPFWQQASTNLIRNIIELYLPRSVFHSRRRSYYLFFNYLYGGPLSATVSAGRGSTFGVDNCLESHKPVEISGLGAQGAPKLGGGRGPTRRSKAAGGPLRGRNGEIYRPGWP